MAEKSEETSTRGKGRPTPKRAAREAANRKPLVGDRSKEALAAERQAAAARRAEYRAGQLSGDEKYLGPRDKGPQRRFVRDYVDVRFSPAELLFPAVLIALVLEFVKSTVVSVAVLGTLWSLLIMIVLNSVILWRGLKKVLAAKFGESRIERGLANYAIMRSLQMRFMRLPRPVVKRGQDLG